MPESTFALSMVLASLESVGYVTAGYLLGRRKVEGEAHLANRLFSLWWFAIGLNKLLNAAISTAFAYGLVGFDAYLSVIYLNVPILCVSLWALLYYLLYLFTGSRRVMVPVTVLYAGYYLLLTYNILSGPPVGAHVSGWRVVLENGGQTPGIVRLATFVLLGLPQILAAFALFTVAFRRVDRTQRYRTVLVSWAIIGWSISILLVAIPPFSEMGVAQMIARLAGLFAALACLAAYVPPRWVRQRLHVEPLGTVAPKARPA